MMLAVSTTVFPGIAMSLIWTYTFLVPAAPAASVHALVGLKSSQTAFLKVLLFDTIMSFTPDPVSAAVMPSVTALDGVLGAPPLIWSVPVGDARSAPALL